MTPIALNRSAAPTPAPMPGAGTPAQREAVKQLAQAFKNEDLTQARQAFAGIVKAAPDGATWNPNSDFAALGRALAAGDLPAAQEAAKAALVGMRSVKMPVQPEPGPSIPGGAASTSTPAATGSSGTLLNVVV